MGIIKELKAFMTRGSVVDMAVGIIIGAAFGKIVSSLVSDVIMPPVGVLLSGMDFTDMKFILKEATANTTAVTINYGQFTQTIIDFLIIATAIFFVIKGINSFNKKTENEENKAPEAPKEEVKPTKEEELLTEIRDLLKKS